jgi:hypothetical protein
MQESKELDVELNLKDEAFKKEVTILKCQFFRSSNIDV